MNNQNYFVGIGAQKAGTSWLADYFQNHPQVCMSHKKELHCFDKIYNGKTKGLQARLKSAMQPLTEKLGVKHNKELNMETFKAIYKQYFETLINKKKDLVFGEITPAYSMLDYRGFQYILDIYPGAKFIFLLRNPADRYWSQLRFYVKQRKTRGNKNMNINWTYNNFQKNLYNQGYVLRTDYTRTLKELEKVVPTSQILVIFYENLFFGNGEKEIKKITDFLGVKYISPELNTIIWKSPEAEMYLDLRVQAIKRFQHVYFGIYRKFMSDFPASWWNDIRLLHQQNSDSLLLNKQNLEKNRSKLLDIQQAL